MKGAVVGGGMVSALIAAAIGGIAAGAGGQTTIDEGTVDNRGKRHGLVYLRAVSQSVASGAARGVAVECNGERRTTGGGTSVAGTTGVPFADSGPIAGYSQKQAWVGT